MNRYHRSATYLGVIRAELGAFTFILWPMPVVSGLRSYLGPTHAVQSTSFELRLSLGGHYQENTAHIYQC